jgi:DNA-binding NarL/FixJ family response regulator
MDQLEDLLLDLKGVSVLAKVSDPLNLVGFLQKTIPDVLFMDIEMPGISGLDLASNVAELSPNTKIIFVTAYSQYAIQAIKKAAFDYLIKPVDPEELSDTLGRLTMIVNRESSTIDRLKLKYTLTSRELDIIEQILFGCTSERIACNLNISRLTVNTHRQNILKKTGCSNFFELFAAIS